ncbi:MAG: helix-turn-helix transcriptional regulator [Eubacteriales bacterium]
MNIGAGTLYTLLDNFVSEHMIVETKVENRKKSYVITDVGKEMLAREYNRLQILISDFDTIMKGE